MVRHILLAVDGPDSSRRAARLARSLVNGLGAKLTLLHVIELPGTRSLWKSCYGP